MAEALGLLVLILVAFCIVVLILFLILFGICYYFAHEIEVRYCSDSLCFVKIRTNRTLLRWDSTAFIHVNYFTHYFGDYIAAINYVLNGVDPEAQV